MIKPQPFHVIYKSLLKEAMNSPQELNVRTGHYTAIIQHGVSFLLRLENNILPTPGVRRVYPKSAAAEIAWYLMGTTDITWLRKHCPIWNQFVEEDGKTISNSYGYRWRWHFRRDQIDAAIETLTNDPTSRQVNISAWDPRQDGLGKQGVKSRNIPCPTNFTLSIINGRLHSSLFLRSSDLFVGLPYDVMGHAYLMSAFARQLSVQLGTMHVTLAHAHIYDDHFRNAKRCIRNKPVVPDMMLPQWSIDNIVAKPDAYVNMVLADAFRHKWHTFQPVPEVIV